MPSRPRSAGSPRARHRPPGRAPPLSRRHRRRGPGTRRSPARRSRPGEPPPSPEPFTRDARLSTGSISPRSAPGPSEACGRRRAQDRERGHKEQESREGPPTTPRSGDRSAGSRPGGDAAAPSGSPSSLGSVSARVAKGRVIGALRGEEFRRGIGAGPPLGRPAAPDLPRRRSPRGRPSEMLPGQHRRGPQPQDETQGPAGRRPRVGHRQRSA